MQFAHQRDALAERHGRIGWKGRVGRVDRAAGFAGARIRHGGDDLVGGGVGHVEGAGVICVAPRAANQVLLAGEMAEIGHQAGLSSWVLAGSLTQAASSAWVGNQTAPRDLAWAIKWSRIQIRER